MKTVNSLSGGKTSSYIAAHYPADYNVFSLVRTDDKKCLFSDSKIRQEVSDRLGTEFIGTLEDDAIIYTMLDLEQYIGQKIDWVTGKSFDELIKIKSSGKTYIPQATKRICTTIMKMYPIMEWWHNNINELVEMRLGFRANERNRMMSVLNKCDKNGIQEDKIRVKINKNKNDKWENKKWRKPSFPLINDNIYKDKVELYWNDKSVRFAWQNNCIGCFHANPLNLQRKSKMFPNKFNWFVQNEQKSIKDYNGRKWLGGGYDGITYKDIQDWNIQTELFDDDFN